jgi:small subunit ribosomal protein S1
VHISELAERHVEIPEQVVQVGDDILVKVIDIDLERRRISLSLKQANEGQLTEENFDPAQYGMEAQYDDKGDYIYPEGFDPDTQEWLPGYDEQRDAWEKRYAAARERFEAHRKQQGDAQKADADAASGAGEATSYTSDTASASADEDGETGAPEPEAAGGTLASDEALAALREKLTGR